MAVRKGSSAGHRAQRLRAGGVYRRADSKKNPAPPFLRRKGKENQSRPYQKRRARNYSGLCFSEQLWVHGFA